MKNIMHLKAIINNIGTVHQQNFILKDGLLIATMASLDTRATMDMDATIKGFPINEQ